MRRPGWYPRAWSSWHLQVVNLHLKSWTSLSASFAFWRSFPGLLSQSRLRPWIALGWIQIQFLLSSHRRLFYTLLAVHLYPSGTPQHVRPCTLQYKTVRKCTVRSLCSDAASWLSVVVCVELTAPLGSRYTAVCTSAHLQCTSYSEYTGGVESLYFSAASSCNDQT